LQEIKTILTVYDIWLKQLLYLTRSLLLYLANSYKPEDHLIMI